MTQPLILVDCMNLVWRSAFAHSTLSTKAGVFTGMYYGFLRSLRQLREISPRLVLCWDEGIPGSRREKSWRYKVLPSYKSHRKEKKTDGIMGSVMPQVQGQYEKLCSVVDNLGFFQAGIPGLEADDIIALICGHCKGPKLIYSNDQDFYQLLDRPEVRVLKPKKEDGKYLYLERKHIEEEFEIRVEEFAAYLAMGGDKSDSIKPLKGMGPMTAIKLIKAGVMPGFPLAKQKALVPAKYHEHWDDIRRSYSVAKLHTEAKQLDALSGLKIEDGVRGMCYQIDRYDRPEYNNPADRLQAFTQFCAEFEMNDFLATRRQFFQTYTS